MKFYLDCSGCFSISLNAFDFFKKMNILNVWLTLLQLVSNYLILFLTAPIANVNVGCCFEHFFSTES